MGAAMDGWMDGWVGVWMSLKRTCYSLLFVLLIERVNFSES